MATLQRDLPLDYVVLDLETTGIDQIRDRIIDIAAIRYHSGEPIDVFQTLVNPQVTIPMRITKLTGITQDMVCDAPTIDQIRDAFLSFIADIPIIGHNADRFDLPFIAAQMCVSLQNAHFDTLKLARLAYPGLKSYKLDYLKDALCLYDGGSHRALDDVKTTNALLCACADRGVPFCPDVAAASAPIAKSKNFSSKSFSANLHPRSSALDENHPFYGKSIVFTGDMEIPRREAAQLAVDCGAIVKNYVSPKTSFLVVGKQDIAVVGFKGTSAKQDKAMYLNQTGKAAIQVLTEEEFMRLVKGDC